MTTTVLFKDNHIHTESRNNCLNFYADAVHHFDVCCLFCCRKKKRSSSSAPQTPGPDVTVVGYYYCNEPIPYRTTIPGSNVTLAQFKQLLTKRGNFR